MTDEQINVAIAKSLGRTYHKPSEEELKTGSYYQYEPNYAGDLNAMHEVLKKLGNGRFYNRSYISLLQKVCGLSDADGYLEKREVFDLVTSTARQQAEAYLRTIGKWEE